MGLLAKAIKADDECKELAEMMGPKIINSLKKSDRAVSDLSFVNGSPEYFRLIQKHLENMGIRTELQANNRGTDYAFTTDSYSLVAGGRNA